MTTPESFALTYRRYPPPLQKAVLSSAHTTSPDAFQRTRQQQRHHKADGVSLQDTTVPSRCCRNTNTCREYTRKHALLVRSFSWFPPRWQEKTSLWSVPWRDVDKRKAFRTVTSRKQKTGSLYILSGSLLALVYHRNRRDDQIHRCRTEKYNCTYTKSIA